MTEPNHQAGDPSLLADGGKARAAGAVEPERQQQLRLRLQERLKDQLVEIPPLAGEYGLAFGAPSKGSRELFKVLRDDPKLAFNMLSDVTAVDWLDRREPRFDVVYQLVSITYQHRLCIKIQLPEENPEVDSVVSLWASASFLEREVFDMFGIKFAGHPDLRRILLYEEFVGFPLRKDYPLRGKQPRLELRIPELRNTSDDMHRGELVALPSKRKIV